MMRLRCEKESIGFEVGEYYCLDITRETKEAWTNQEYITIYYETIFEVIDKNGIKVKITKDDIVSFFGGKIYFPEKIDGIECCISKGDYTI